MIDALRNENRASVEHHECVFKFLLFISPSMPNIFERMWLIVDTLEGNFLGHLQISRSTLLWCISI